MTITRRLVSHCDGDTQAMAVNSSQRYVVNAEDCWQFLFGPKSSLGAAAPGIKIAAQFDTTNSDRIRMVAYLYDSVVANVRKAAMCSFDIHYVTQSGISWSDVPLTTVVGSELTNSYWFASEVLTNLIPANLDGDVTLMIEATVTRHGKVYRDRVYLNHLGVYDSIVRLRQDVEFLDLTKLDE